MAAVKRVSVSVKEAIYAIQNFVMNDTGKRPTQNEIAEALGSYLAMNEINETIKAMRSGYETEE